MKHISRYLAHIWRRVTQPVRQYSFGEGGSSGAVFDSAWLEASEGMGIGGTALSPSTASSSTGVFGATVPGRGSIAVLRLTRLSSSVGVCACLCFPNACELRTRICSYSKRMHNSNPNSVRAV